MRAQLPTGVFALLALGCSCRADGIVVQKVYDPYVQPLEREFEMRLLFQDDADLAVKEHHMFSAARSIGERVFVELYAIGESRRDAGFDFDGVEAELKWQLTEQGEFFADWGLLFELEREFSTNAWEGTTALLVSKQLGSWVATGNLRLTYETQRASSEWETALNAEMRYRMGEKFEPSLELHLGQNTFAAGPAAGGTVRLGPGRQLRWHLGVLPGLSADSADITTTFVLEYEF